MKVRTADGNMRKQFQEKNTGFISSMNYIGLRIPMWNVQWEIHHRL